MRPGEMVGRHRSNYQRKIENLEAAQFLVVRLLGKPACRDKHHDELRDIKDILYSRNLTESEFSKALTKLNELKRLFLDQPTFASAAYMLPPDNPNGLSADAGPNAIQQPVAPAKPAYSGRTPEQAKQFVKSRIFDLMNNKSCTHYLSNNDEVELSKLNEKIRKDKTGESKMADEGWLNAAKWFDMLNSKIANKGE